jgi:hypothetical protein
MAHAVFTPAGKTIEVARTIPQLPMYARSVRGDANVPGALVAVVARLACAKVLNARAVSTPAGKTIEVARTTAGLMPARTVLVVAKVSGA